MRQDGAKPFVAIRPWLRAGLLRHLSPTASRVLFLLVDYAHKDGYSYPSARLLSKQSGHARKRIYAALKELEAIGCIQRKQGLEGRTRFSKGNHPGPVYYWIPELDHATSERLSRKPSRKSKRGDPARFTRREMSQSEEHLTKLEMYQRQEHLEPERCTNTSPTDVPETAPRDVPENVQLMSQSQEHKESLKRKKRRVFEESPPIPSLGECSFQGQALQRASSSSLSFQNEKPKSTAREKQKADLVKFFQAEFSTANGVKPLDEYLKWFPPTYGREDVEWAYQEASGFQAGAT